MKKIKQGEELEPQTGCMNQGQRGLSEEVAFELSPEWSARVGMEGGHVVVCVGESQRERPGVGAPQEQIRAF